MQVLRYALAFVGMLAVLAIALLGGFFIMGPLMKGAGDSGPAPAGDETQVAISSVEAFPTRAPSNTPLSAADLLPTRVPSNTPLTAVSELPTRAPTAATLETDAPAPLTATPEPLPEPTWTQTPTSATTAEETVVVPSPETSVTAVVGAPASIVVVPATLTVREPEGSGTFIISLSSEPEGTVIIPLSVTGDECSVIPDEVTLDGSNWSTGANVAVMVVDDALVDGDQVCMVGTGSARSSGADYAEMSVDDVTVTVEDDDMAGIAVAPVSLTASEPGGSEVFVISLSSEPEGAVTIPLNVESDECSVAQGEVTLDSANWRTGVSVEVAVVDDDVQDGDQVCVVAIGAARSSGADYADMSVENVTLTVEDDDAAGIVIAPATLTVRESEGSETFVVTLSSEPEGPVSIPLSVASDECSVTPGEVALDKANWGTGVSVAVAAVDDAAEDGDQVCVVGIGAARSSGADYAGMTVEDVVVTVVDDDMAGIVVMPGKLTVAEPEGSEMLVIALSSEPEAAVSVPLSAAGDECSVTPGEVTLDKANWRTGVSVAVAAQDDEVEDGDQECAIGIGPVTSGGADYADVTVKDVVVTVIDDDVAGIVTSPVNLTVQESGASEPFVITLSSEPEAAVSIALSVASDECSVTPGEVTLDPATWRGGVSVAVAPVDDKEEDGDQDCVVTIGAARSAGADYDGLNVEDVMVTVVDDDAAGIVVAPASLVVSELEGSGTYAISLNSKPADTVLVSLSTDEQIVVNPTSLTFTVRDWNVPQSVVVTVADDNIAEGQHSSRIGQTVSSSDEKYDRIAVDSMTISITDNETAGVIITPNEVAVGEGEGPEAYVVVLASQPSRKVEISVSTDGQTAVDPVQLTFRRAEWNAPQMVNVRAVDDDVSEGPHVSIISHVASSDDEDYRDVPIDDVIARIADSGAASVAVVVTQSVPESVPESSSSSDSSPFDPIRNIEISPALILVVVLAAVASLVELRSARKRKDRD
jgi:hypothetical protein